MSILIVNIDHPVPISDHKYPSRLIVKHGFQSHSTSGLEVSCDALILEFGQAEYTVFTYRIEIAEGSIRVQTHHSLGVSLQDFVLLISHVIVFFGDKQLISDSTVQSNKESFHVSTPMKNICL